jgi:MFS family permease
VGGVSGIVNIPNSVTDLGPSHERALATSIFSLAPFLGPVVGPIVGGFIAENCSYHIVFWVQFAFGA